MTLLDRSHKLEFNAMLTLILETYLRVKLTLQEQQTIPASRGNQRHGELHQILTGVANRHEEEEEWERKRFAMKKGENIAFDLFDVRSIS